MAHEAEKPELKEKLAALVAAKFEGDSRAAFAYYDLDGDGKIRRSELIELLTDAGIGDWFTRGRWADGIIAELDKDGDGMLTMNDISEKPIA